MKFPCGCDLPSMSDTQTFVCRHQVWQVSHGKQKRSSWVKLLQRLSHPQDIGLGATAKRIAAKFGGERFKRWATKVGLPCGCTDREIEWNSLYPNPNHKGSDSTK